MDADALNDIADQLDAAAEPTTPVGTRVRILTGNLGGYDAASRRFLRDVTVNSGAEGVVSAETDDDGWVMVDTVIQDGRTVSVPVSHRMFEVIR